jgi:hypothetical protein
MNGRKYDEHILCDLGIAQVTACQRIYPIVQGTNEYV